MVKRIIMTGLMMTLFVMVGSGLMGQAADFLRTVEKKELTPAELARLKKGEVLVLEEAKGQRMRYVMAKVWIDRSPDRVWKTLSNQEALFKGDSRMKRVKVVKTIPPRTQHIAYTLSVSRLFPAFDYTTRVDFLKPSWLIQFVRMSGSFKSFKGFAKLKPIEGGQQTVMVYALQLDSGPLLPQFLVRTVLKSSLPDLMREVRHQVHSQNPCIQAIPEPCPAK